LLVANRFADRVGKILNVLSCYSPFLIGLTDPDRNSSLEAVKALRILFWHSAEGSQHELAELVGGCFGQPTRFIHTPVLDREIWNRQDLS
jgi:hypothetical protein